jgi:catechol 2,3-dioxygenase-like lactoylglutathione lyase family enzyme
LNTIPFTGVCLITSDVLKLRQFYEQVLQVSGEGDDRHSVLAVSGATLSLFSCLGMEEMAPGSMQGTGYGSLTLEFQVEDVDQETARLLSQHVPLVKPPLTYPWGRRSAWFRDPDGNILNFYSVVS